MADSIAEIDRRAQVAAGLAALSRSANFSVAARSITSLFIRNSA